MKLLDALLGRTTEVVEERQRPIGLVIRAAGVDVRTTWVDWNLSKDGETEWRGFQPFDPATSRWIFADEVPPALSRKGFRICAVAGISKYSGRVVADFAPGRQVLLVREPTNRYDGNAIAVRSMDARVLTGYVPRHIASNVAPEIDNGTRYDAVVIWEVRRAGTRGRVGLRLFFGQTSKS